MEPTTSSIIASVMMSMAQMMDPNQQIDQAQLECLANNVFFEAGVESREGKRAVAHVTLNLVKKSDFKDSICDVVTAGVKEGRKDCRFSWVCDGKKDSIDFKLAWTREEYAKSVEESILAILELTPDVSKGATHYYAQNLVTPPWSKSGELVKTVVIGDHTFMMPAKEVAYRF